MSGDGVEWVLLVPLSRDPISPQAAVSVLYRVFEEYPLSRIVLLPSMSVEREQLDPVIRVAVVLAGSEDRVAVRRVCVSPECPGKAKGGLDPLLSDVMDLLGEECGGKERRCIVAPSPAGRRLASALSVAASQTVSDLVYLYFYFGPWTGLHYPYVPRRLEPMIVMQSDKGPSGEARVAALERYAAKLSWNPESMRCAGTEGKPGPLGARLPPLRCAVAETARRLNALGGRFVVDRGEVEGECAKLSVEVQGNERGADLCDPHSVGRLARFLAEALRDLGVPEQVAPWLGAADLEAHEGYGVPAEPLEDAAGGHPLLVDSNLIYQGIHVYAWSGVKVWIPECAQAEVERNLAEAVKRGRIKDGHALLRALAFLALEDLLAAGAVLVPSHLADCDTAIPKLDPVILHAAVPATSDDGAYRYWTRHPAMMARGRPRSLKVIYDPDSGPSLSRLDSGDPRVLEAELPRLHASLPRAYYALVQGLIALDLAVQTLESAKDAKLKFNVDPAPGGEARFRPASGILRAALGIKALREG